MEYTEFLKQAETILAERNSNYEYTWDIEKRPKAYEDDDYSKDTDFLNVRWEIGGVSGGSCWESSDPQPYYTGTQAPRFSVLSKLLRSVCPDISFLVYEEIQDMVQSGEYTDHEYYGNSMSYAYLCIHLPTLHEFLKNNKLL